jgi:hypothetical protein
MGARLARNPDLLCGAALSAALCLIAFFSGDGSASLSANTWVQVALLVLGAAALISLALWWVPAPRWGLPAVLAFLALAALTYLSLAWSVAPGTSWLEANRTLSYLAVFTAMAVFGRLAPGRWRGVVLAAALSATAVMGWSLVVKVFPDVLDRGDPLGRLNVPLGYWNAVGDLAAMGIPAVLWLGADPRSHRMLRALAPPALAVLISAVMMSVSRGALIAAVIGVGVWFAVVPLRLRAVAVLALGAAGAAAISGWALSDNGISGDNVAQHVRVASGHTFGIVLIVTVLLAAAAGWALAIAMERFVLPERLRRQISTALLVLVALLPVAAVAGLAVSSRGLTGEISHLWDTVTNPRGGAGNNPSRLLTLSNSRTRYWRVGLKVGEHHLLAGTGALGFAVAHLRYATQPLPVTHAHDFWIETFADFGLIGVAVALVLFLAWGLAAARALGIRGPPASRPAAASYPQGAPDRQPKPGPATPDPRTEERTGLLTLVTIVLIFGLHSLIDWPWFIPGCAVLALACAGWLAGRGPLEAPVGRATARRQLMRSPGLGAVCAGVVALLIGAVWVIVAPLRSADAGASAISALQRGDSAAALTDARQAASANPLALEPLYLLSAIYQARGDTAAARAELVKAVALEPENPSPWQTLGSFDVSQNHAKLALGELERARVLDPYSEQLVKLIARAQAAGG